MRIKSLLRIPLSWWLMWGIVVISLLVSYWISSQIYPFRITSSAFRQWPESVAHLYHDFHDDGVSESVAVTQNMDSSFTGIVLRRHDLTYLEQFNFSGIVSFRNLPGSNWIYIADYNEDFVDDLFVFHKWQDTLYLALVDVNQLAIQWDIPVLTRDPPVAGKPWDVYLNAVQLVRLMEGESPVLLFSILTGHALWPRGLYAFDLEKRTIEYRYETRTSILDFHVCDANKDGRREIYLSTNSSDNFPEDSPQPNDHFSWYIVLNHELKPLFEPKLMGPPYSATFTTCLHPSSPNERTRIISLFSYNGKEDRSSRLIEWTIDGRRKRNYSLYHKQIGQFYAFKEFPDRFFVKFTSPSMISAYNNDWDQIGSIEYRGPLLELKPYTIAENESCLLLITQSEIIFFSPEDFNLLARTKHQLNPLMDKPFVSIFRDKNFAFPKIAISDGQFEYQYQIRENPLYTWRYLLATGIFVLLVAGGYTVKVLVSFLILVFGYFIAMLKNNPNATLVLRPDGRIALHNSRLQKLFGITASQVRHLNHLRHLFPELAEKLDAAMEKRQTFQGRVSLVRRQDETLIEIKVIPFRFWRHPFAFYVEFQENVTAPLSERLQLWASAVQQLAHDIKSPVSSLKFSLRVLEERVKKSSVDEERKQKLLETIHDQLEVVEEIAGRTQKFLKVNNIIRPQLTRQHLHDVIEKAVHHFRKFLDTGEIRMNISLDDSIPAFCFDKDQMEILFNTLIENALDAMKGSGQLSITTLLQEDIIDGQTYVEISIADTAGGIPPDVQEQLFKKRITTKSEKGSGIGLLLAKNIVDNHGGSIQFRTGKNGTVFVIRIPIKQDCGGRNARENAHSGGR